MLWRAWTKEGGGLLAADSPRMSFELYEALGERGGTGRYVSVDTLEPVEFLPGLGFRPVLGQRVLTNFVNFQPGTTAPRHVHEEEQIVIVLDG